MTLTPHPNLPGYYTSSFGGWDFSREDDTLEATEEAIEAWTEWRSFLLHRERIENEENLF